MCAQAKLLGFGLHWLAGTFVLLGLARTASGCHRAAARERAGEGAQTTREENGETPPRVPFDVRNDRTDLTFFWFDEQGKAHGAARMTEVPEARRGKVRVDPSRPELRAPGWVYLADLRAPGPDGRFPVQAVASEEFASQLAALNGLAAVMGQPAEAPVVAPTTPSVLRPQAPAPGGARARQVIIYGASWCSACHQAAAYLRSQNIQFVERDIEREPEAAQEMMTLARAQGVPTASIPIINVNGRLLVGFNPEAIQQAMRGG